MLKNKERNYFNIAAIHFNFNNIQINNRSIDFEIVNINLN